MFILGNSWKNELVRKREENKYYDESIEIDINDKNNSHSIISKYIKNGSTVLDIGCGAGYIGKLLKDKNCKVYGIDLDSKALEYAKKTNAYKDVKKYSICDLKENDKIFKEQAKFDYIIFADVLEHLVNPGEVLHLCSMLLSDKGEILVSIPNVAHFDIIKGLTDGVFNYNKIGILDNTHVRFFTNNSFIEMIESINNVYGNKLDIKKIGKTISKPDYIEKYPSINNLINSNEELYVLQNIFTIKKNNKVKSKKIEKIYNFDMLEKTLNDNNVVIKNYEKEIAEKADCIDQLKNEVKEKADYINELKIDVDNKSECIINLENEMTKKEEELEQLKNEIDQIKSRKIWKLMFFLTRSK